MKHFMFGLGLILAASAANAQSVEVAVGDWSNIPVISPRGDLRMSNQVLDRVHAIGAEGACQVRGLRRTSVDLTVPFLVRFGANGEVERVVLRDLNCPRLETVLGAAVLQLAQSGEYRPTGQNPERWYRSELSFVSR